MDSRPTLWKMFSRKVFCMEPAIAEVALNCADSKNTL